MRAHAAVVLCALATSTVARGEEEKPQITPRLKECRLVVRGESLPPVRILPGGAREERIGSHVLAIREDRIEESRPGQEPAWTAKIDGGQKIWSIVGEGDRAWVLTCVEENGYFKGFDPEARIRVLDLASGAWKEALHVPGTDGKPKLERIGAISVHERRLAVLSLWGEEPKEELQSGTTHYQVDCFLVDSSEPLWSRRFEVGDTREYDGALLWGVPGPRYARSDLQAFTWIDEELLVCAEARQPVMMLSRHSGRTIWKIPRIWELERGFIGPSVYEYFIGRFGQGGMGEEETADLAALRKDFNEHWSASIVGGPVVVPLPFGRTRSAYSIWVAVLKAPAKGPSYLGDCVVYELDEHGTPLSIGKLPQMVEGGAAVADEGGVVWRGFNGAFARIAASPGDRMHGVGRGSDRTSTIDWFRQDRLEPLESVFESATAGDPTAFGSRHAFTLTEGGMLRDMAVPLYAFPVAATSLRDGSSERLLLEVPFDGKFELPRTNMGSDGHKTTAYTPHLLAVTQLEARGTILSVTLGRSGSADRLEFDLRNSPLFKGAPATPAEVREARAEARVKTMKDVNAKAKDWGGTPIFEAVKASDVALVEALIRAGADVNARTKNGYSPLMSAALYARADVFELLIKRGADVNVDDGGAVGCAVYGNFQAARKLRALLAAKADPNKKYGYAHYTPLMSAVVEGGKLTCVEVLLEFGADPGIKTADGKSALDLAREKNLQDIAEVLERAMKKK